jgi:hypothetical protein
MEVVCTSNLSRTSVRQEAYNPDSQPASHIKIPEEDNRKHRPKSYVYQIVRASDFTVSMIPLGEKETATQSYHKNGYSYVHI